MKNGFKILFVVKILILIITSQSLFSKLDFNTNVTTINNHASGYINIETVYSEKFFLIDNYDQLLFLDSVPNRSVNSFKMLSNGNWLCCGEDKYYVLNQQFVLIDSILIPNNYIFDFHEIIVLRNGHYLITALDTVRMDMSQIVEDGKKDALIHYNIIVEIDKYGNEYWSWNTLDYLSLTDVTWEVSLTTNVIDFTHVNSLIEDNDGNIWVSVRHFDEIIKINKTTQEIIWRMGGSESKHNQFTFINDEQNGFVGFSHQHTISLLSNGNLLMYDNGNLKPNQVSRAVEYQINQTTKTATKVWEYYHPTGLFAISMGGVKRLCNGNTLINWGISYITEVKPDNTVAFEMEIPPGYSIYRADRIIYKMDAVTRYANSVSNYIFNNSNYNTGITLNISSINGSDSLTVEKHRYEPPQASFIDSCFSYIFPYRWVVKQNTISNIAGVVKINTNSFNDISLDYNKVIVWNRSAENGGMFYELPTAYNSATGEITATFTQLGEFTISNNNLIAPLLTTPVNNDTIIHINGALHWNSVTGANRYRIQVSSKADFSTKIIDSTLLNQNQIDYKNLRNNTRYYWRCFAISSKDSSIWSDINTFRTEHIPHAILNYPSNNYSGMLLQDTLRWYESEFATFYHIQISKNNTFTDLVVDSIPDYNISYGYTGLEYNTRYYWRVRACCTYDSSSWSDVRIFSTVLPGPQLLYPANDTINVDSKLVLIWEEMNNAQSYVVNISEKPDFSVIYLYEPNYKNTYYTINNLSTDKTLYWRIAANNFGKQGEWSETRSFKTLLAAPELVTPINDAQRVPKNNTFTWETDNDFTSFSFQISESFNFNSILIDSNIVALKSVTINSLPSDTKLYWRVRTNNNSQLSKWSSIWCFTTIYDNLETPVLNYPTNGLETNLDLKFNWKKVNYATNYILQISTDIQFTEISFDTTIKSTTFNYSNLDYNKTYYWRVKAFNEYDKSEWSEIRFFETDRKLQAVKLINPLNKAVFVQLQGSCNWESIAEADKYTIQISEDKGFNTLVVNHNTGKNNSYNYEDLNMNTQYYWRVRYSIDDDTSSWSNVWSFLTMGLDSLATPILVSPNDNQSGVGLEGDFVWNLVEDAQYYELALSLDSNFDTVFISTANINDTTLFYNELEYNTTYFWRISASNSKSISQWSSIRSFITVMESPEILSPVNFSTNTNFIGNISWTPIDYADYYHIQISTDSLFPNPEVDRVDITEPNFDYQLDDNTTYYLRVRATTPKNFSTWSKMITFTTSSTSIPTDNNKKINIGFYPNPVNDNIFINSHDFNNCYYTIYSITGIKVQAEQILDNSINVSKLNAGLYYLRIANIDWLFVKE